MPKTNTWPTRDQQRCACGHTGAEHALSYMHCNICRQSPDGRFRCEHGTCDRFTWDPDANRKQGDNAP